MAEPDWLMVGRDRYAHDPVFHAVVEVIVQERLARRPDLAAALLKFIRTEHPHTYTFMGTDDGEETGLVSWPLIDEAHDPASDKYMPPTELGCKRCTFEAWLKEQT